MRPEFNEAALVPGGPVAVVAHQFDGLEGAAFLLGLALLVADQAGSPRADDLDAITLGVSALGVEAAQEEREGEQEEER